MTTDRMDFDLIILLIIFLIFIFGIVAPLLFLRFKKKFGIKTIFFQFKWRILFYTLLLLVITLSWMYFIYASSGPRIIKTYPGGSETWTNYKDPIEIKFSVPVVVSKLDPNINPGIAGEWVWEPYLGLKDLSRVGRFYPVETFFPEQRVVVYIVGVSRLFHTENHEMGVDFQSMKLPTITAISPENENKEVLNDQSIELTLSHENDHAIEYSFSIEPQLNLEVSNIYASSITINPKENFNQNTQYKLTVLKRVIRYNLEEDKVVEYKEGDESEVYTFTTVKAPLIDSFLPTGNGIKDDAVISIKFSTPMHKDMVENELSFSPEISGVFEWTDDLNMTFTPSEPLTKETNYKVTFPQGLKSMEGGIFEKDLVQEFNTIGGVKVSGIIPIDRAVSVVEDMSFQIFFDQEVNKESAQQSFKIEPAIEGIFRWEGNTMIYDPTGKFGFTSTYTVTLAAGIKSIYGLDSKEGFSSSFTVRANEVVIGGIPNLYQPQPSFSCNIYTALMILHWKGFTNTYTRGLISEIGYNPNQYNGTWTGNPYKEFVGNSDGSWGYGVYWNPIKSILANRGINSEIHENWNMAGVARAVSEGHPVIIWRYNGESADYDKDWVASDGTYVNGINGEHGGVITGFRGDVNNPYQIYLNDSWYGPGWYDVNTLDYYWSRLGRVGLVVY